MKAEFEYVFPAIRGVQAGREYYVSMCPLRLIPKIFIFDGEELVPELRAQRRLNRSRVPAISRYLLKHKTDYVFSALTASIDSDVVFVPAGEESKSNRIGVLRIPMTARFVINDGQHRRAAIEMALREEPDLGDETIAVVFFLDVGLERCQQMFTDLNRYAVRPSKSLEVLFDHREDMSKVAKTVAERSVAFKDVVEPEKSTLSSRSRKLFTLSAIYSASEALLQGHESKPLDEQVETAISFWDEVAKYIPEWQLVRQKKMTSGDVRQDFVHSHGIALQALGNVGNALLRDHPQSWQDKLLPLGKLDWSRSNASLWEGRAMVGGRMTNSTQNVALTTNLLKSLLTLPSTPEEQRVENAFLRGEHVA